MNAQPSVSASPAPNENDPPSSKNKPTTANPTATKTLRAGRRRVTTVSSNGVNTTKSPVMKAEFDVVVRCKPAFWSQ